jgi:hypothetical protein
MIKYPVGNHSFLCDGLPGYPHYSPITMLKFISRSASGISQIGVLDEMGIISVWNITEVASHLITDFDLNISLGGKFKMVLNYTENLVEYPHVIDITRITDVTQGIEIEFDPEDAQTFFFSTSEGLFKLSKTDGSGEPIKIDTIGLNSPTALSMSDKGFLLAAFSCGSIW